MHVISKHKIDQPENVDGFLLIFEQSAPDVLATHRLGSNVLGFKKKAAKLLKLSQSSSDSIAILLTHYSIEMHSPCKKTRRCKRKLCCGRACLCCSSI